VFASLVYSAFIIRESLLHQRGVVSLFAEHGGRHCAQRSSIMLIVISIVWCTHGSYIYAMYKINVSIVTFPVLWLCFASEADLDGYKLVHLSADPHYQAEVEHTVRNHMILSGFKYENFSSSFP
jgi:hypothetical protein